MDVLKKILKQNRKWVILAVLFAVVHNCVGILSTHFVGKLVNRIADGSQISLLLIGILILFGLLNPLTSYVNHLLGQYTAERAAHSLRMGYMRHLLKDGSTSADQAMSVVQGELTRATEYLSNSFFSNVGMLITSILVFLFLLYENPILTAVLLIPNLTILIYVSISGSTIAKTVKKGLEARSRMNHVAFGIVSNFPIVSVYDASAFLEEKHDEALADWEKHTKKEERIIAVLNSISGLLSQIPLLCVLLTGGILIFRGSMTLGTLIVFLNLQSSVTMFLMNMPNFIAYFRTFTSNLRRIELA